MANQETSFQKSPASLGSRRLSMVWLMIGAAIVVLAIAVMFLVLAGGQSPVIEQEPAIPAVAPAAVDRHDLARGLAEEGGETASGLYPQISATPWEYNHGR